MTQRSHTDHPPISLARIVIDRRACPFCRSPEQTELEVEAGEWVVVCHGCKAIGPSALSSGAAIRYWNGGD
jgi:hypothetical protein